ncbi:MAG: phytase, partial [Calditrichota bacterium]
LSHSVYLLFTILFLSMLSGCQTAPKTAEAPVKESITFDDITYVEVFKPLQPVVSTEPVNADSDDPAVWIHPTDPAQSLILGTDKGDDDEGIDGGLFMFDMSGKMIKKEIVSFNVRPNNVDVEYGLQLGDETVDVAIMTIRGTRQIRVYRMPELEPIDDGGLDVFVGEEDDMRRVMGVSTYKRSSDNAIFVILSRKEGPSGDYLWQYQLKDAGDGTVKIEKVRSFGLWSGAPGEIEAIVVDDALGYVYYSDELLGIRKYHADPDHPNAAEELAIFGIDNFVSDREGLSIYAVDEKTGYLLVSDQQSNRFHVYKREGEPGDPHQHNRVKIFKSSTESSDGSETVSVPLGKNFPQGLFIAMSEDKTFKMYSWSDIAGDELKSAN